MSTRRCSRCAEPRADWTSGHFQRPFSLSNSSLTCYTGMTMESSASTVEAARERSAAEPPIFVADDPWRGRAVRAAGAIGAVLLATWVVAIVAGALGFGSLPGVPLTGGGSPVKSAPATTGAAGGASAAKSGSGAAGRPGVAPAADAARTTSTGTAPGSKSGAQSPAAGPATGGTGTVAGQGTGGTATAPTPPSSTTAPGNGSASAPTASGGGPPTATPSGNTPATNAHGANPNADGANAVAGTYSSAGGAKAGTTTGRGNGQDSSLTTTTG